MPVKKRPLWFPKEEARCRNKGSVARNRYQLREEIEAAKQGMARLQAKAAAIRADVASGRI